MGRPERPVDPEAGPVQRFAWELRRLRERAGSPSYRRLARRACYSATALSEAAGGVELPSLAVALAYVEACGGDVVEWEAHWRRAVARRDGGGSAAADSAAVPAPCAARVFQLGAPDPHATSASPVSRRLPRSGTACTRKALSVSVLSGMAVVAILAVVRLRPRVLASDAGRIATIRDYRAALRSALSDRTSRTITHFEVGVPDSRACESKGISGLVSG